MATPSLVDGALEDFATIRVALLPVGAISREVYERYAALVRRQVGRSGFGTQAGERRRRAHWGARSAGANRARRLVSLVGAAAVTAAAVAGACIVGELGGSRALGRPPD